MITSTVATIIQAVFPSLNTGAGSEASPGASGVASGDVSASIIGSAAEKVDIASKFSAAKPTFKFNRLKHRMLINDNINNIFFIIVSSD